MIVLNILYFKICLESKDFQDIKEIFLFILSKSL
jgi:hypothetical protein